MDWGGKAAWLEQMAVESGEVLPALQTKVLPKQHLLFVWNAFGKLSTERSIGMATGPIPAITATLRYARDCRIADAERFGRLIAAMDAAFMNHLAERNAGST